MEPHLLEDCKSWRIPNTDWTIHGFSQAANKTGFAIFSLKMLFDAGIPTQKNCNIVLLTHSHSDHSFNIPCIAMGHRNVCPVYCPKEMILPLKLMCRASQSLNDCVELLDEDQVTAIGVSPGDSFEYKNIIVRVVRCCHTVASVGFEILQKKTLLKEQYKHHEGKDLVALKKSGVEITETVEVKKFTFLGDTTVKVFENKSILESPVIFVECTILDGKVSPEETMERGHIHWKQLQPIVENNPKTLFVLIHLSKRYSPEDAKKVFADAPLNVHLW